MVQVIALLLLLAGLAHGQTFSRSPAFIGGTTHAGQASAPTPDLFWYKLNEGSGAVMGSSTGTSNNAAFAAAWVTGQSGSGGAADFNGSSHYCASTNTVAIGTNVWTYAAWLYFDSTNGVRVVMESGANYNANAGAYILYIDDGKLVASVSQNGIAKYWTYSVLAADFPSMSAWHHVLVVFDTSSDSSTLKIYVDGSEKSTSASGTNRDAAARVC